LCENTKVCSKAGPESHDCENVTYLGLGSRAGPGKLSFASKLSHIARYSSV